MNEESSSQYMRNNKPVSGDVTIYTSAEHIRWWCKNLIGSPNQYVNNDYNSLI